MVKNREKDWQRVGLEVAKKSWPMVATVTTGLLGFAAFTKKIADEIRLRDNQECAESGIPSRETAHYCHNKSDPEYDLPFNGRVLSLDRHYEHHVKCHGVPDLGLSEIGNIKSVRLIWARLKKRPKDMKRAKERGLPSLKEFEADPYAYQDPAYADKVRLQREEFRREYFRRLREQEAYYQDFLPGWEDDSPAAAAR